MDIQFPQILFQAVNFFVVMGSLTFLMYRPILKLFAERAQRIEEGQKAAEDAIAQRDSIDELQKQTELKIEEKTSKALAKAMEEATAEKERILTEAREEATREIEVMKQKWNDEKAQMLKGINDQLVEAVLQVSTKVVGSSLNTAQHNKLIDNELSTMLKKI